jgi:hypothetical protein
VSLKPRCLLNLGLWYVVIYKIIRWYHSVVRLQHIIENCFPATSKKQHNASHTTHNIIKNITGKNRENSIFIAPQHHPPMPPTKDMGVFNQNRRGCPTATPLSTSRYSGVDLIGRARERRHRLMGCIFLAKFGRRGGLIP